MIKNNFFLFFFLILCINIASATLEFDSSTGQYGLNILEAMVISDINTDITIWFEDDSGTVIGMVSTDDTTIGFFGFDDLENNKNYTIFANNSEGDEINMTVFMTSDNGVYFTDDSTSSGDTDINDVIMFAYSNIFTRFTMYLNYSGGLETHSNINSNKNITIDFSGLPDDTYIFYVKAVYDDDITVYSETRTVTICEALTTYYLDADGDNYGDNNTYLDKCFQPEGYVTDNTDCDDSDSTKNVDCIIPVITSIKSSRDNIFISFSIISLIAIISAVFLIINMFNGGIDQASLIAITIGIISISIIIFIGYVIIDNVYVAGSIV